ncbi:MAG: cyclic nucleotide-binding domain-containing protein [Ardenticatenaceae bacterium]|nr:cyclic nucleotide-binding domain-containing protein [Ardenticatenaceae bacterium]
MNWWQGRLLSLLNIQADEARLVGLMLAYAILLYAANVLAQTAAYALFLTQFNATMLPYAYVGMSLAMLLVTAVYPRLTQRYPLNKVLLVVPGFLLIILMAYRLGMTAAWLLVTLPIYAAVHNRLAAATVGSLGERAFNLQQSQWLWGLLRSGEQVAAIVAGFLTLLLVDWLGTANLLAAAGGLLVVVMVLARQIAGQQMAAVAEDVVAETADPHPPPSPAPSPLTSPYLRLIISLVVPFIIGIYVVDNIFYSQVERQYPQVEALAGFLGLFWGVTGVLRLCLQAVGTGRLLKRVGVRAMILATPIGLLLLLGLFAWLGEGGAGTAVLFILITLAHLYRHTLEGVNGATVSVLYQPLPAAQRRQVQTTVSGFVYPLALGAAGVILLFTHWLDFTPLGLASVSLVVVAVWLALGLRVGRVYPQQVQQALAERLFQGEAQLSWDEATLAIVRQSLSSPHVGVALYALETLAHNHPQAMAAVLPDLLAHPVAEVRQEVLHQIEGMRLTGALTAVRHHITHEKVPSVQAAALRALASLDETRVMAEIEPYLAHHEAQIQQGALVGLLRNGQTAVRHEAQLRLIQLAHSPQVMDRALAAQTICEVGGPDLQATLEPLLSDGNLQVRRSALTAAAHYADLWPELVAALAVLETRTVAAAGLIAAGATAVPLLQRAFTTEQNGEVLWQLARILGRVGTPSAIAFLSQHPHHPAHHVRRQILAALVQAGFVASGEEATAVDQQIHAEAEQAAITMRTIMDLQKDERQDEVLLLLRALLLQLRYHQENIVALLSFMYDAAMIWRVWAILQPTATAVAEQRAYALATLEHEVAAVHLALLLPFVQGQDMPEQLALLSHVFPQNSQLRVQRLQDFMNGSHRWLQLCALFGVGRLGLYHEAVVQAVAAAALAHGDGTVVWETAVWTLAQLRESVVDKIMAEVEGTAVVPLMHQINLRRSGQMRGLPLMGRVDILQRTSLFGEARAETLLDVAGRLTEVFYAPEEMVFAKGAPGDSMYMIVSGKVRVHDGAHTHNFLGGADVFGEMALLDPEPRTAAVTAVEPTHLLRLDQEPFWELLVNQPSLSRGIIQVLSRHLRARVRDLAELRRTVLAGPVVLPPEAGEVEVTAVAAPLMPIERLILLKRVEMFCNLPNNILTELALLLREDQLAPQEAVFAKGDPGDALYIIAEGRVRVHDGEHTLNFLQEGDVFGEMALLDPEPRLAAVTAVATTRLLRLDQTPFYQLLEEHAEIATPIIHILSTHLRNRMQDLAELKASLS